MTPVFPWSDRRFLLHSFSFFSLFFFFFLFTKRLELEDKAISKQATMAKNKRKRPLPSSDTGNATGAESSWSSIPGHRLTVDIGAGEKQGVTVAAAAAAPVKGHQESDVSDDDSFDDDAFLNTSNWTSQHYEIDDDEAFHKTAESEFWDPNPNAKSNKFDAAAKLDGAHDDGMFLRLVLALLLCISICI